MTVLLEYLWWNNLLPDITLNYNPTSKITHFFRNMKSIITLMLMWQFKMDTGGIQEIRNHEVLYLVILCFLSAPACIFAATCISPLLKI